MFPLFFNVIFGVNESSNYCYISILKKEKSWYINSNKNNEFIYFKIESIDIFCKYVK